MPREPLTAAPPAEGLERSFSRVCQGKRLPTPAWEEISPPFPRGRDRAFRLTGNGAFEDYYSVQLQRGKPGAAATSVPPPFYPPLLSNNPCPRDPPSFPRPLPGAPRAARCQQQGEGQGG